MLRVALVLLLHLSLAPSSRAAETQVDLELVLAVDASSSVDEAEWRLQMEGIAAAFRDAQVHEAIRSGPNGRIAVAIVMWADATVPKDETAWFVLASDAEADAFGDTVRGLERRVIGGTGIGAGVAYAIRKFDRNGLDALRQVVDVSGDGRETPARELVVLMPAARGMALVRGVTINGLAIVNDDPELAAWYRANVIAGPGGFVIPAADYDDFAEAMRRKLIREIRYEPRVGAVRRAAAR